METTKRLDATILFEYDCQCEMEVIYFDWKIERINDKAY